MSEFFLYDWEVHGEPATFLVDLSYEEIPEGFPLMLCCGIGAMEAHAPLTKKEYARAEKLGKKLQKELKGACFVGRICTEALQQYYFYIDSDEGIHDLLESASYKERLVHLQHSVSHDPHWSIYKDLLFPDSAKYQTALNEQLIEQQRKAGDAVEKVRRLTLLMCFPTEQDKIFFQEAARKAGFAIGESSYASELPLPHLLSIHALSKLHKREIDALTTKAIRTCDAHFGQLLRWTCPRISKKSPLA